MTPAVPVGTHAEPKLPLPIVISVAVLALGATGCSGGNPPNTDGGSCTGSGCFLNMTADGGYECLCA